MSSTPIMNSFVCAFCGNSRVAKQKRKMLNIFFLLQIPQIVTLLITFITTLITIFEILTTALKSSIQIIYFSANAIISANRGITVFAVTTCNTILIVLRIKADLHAGD